MANSVSTAKFTKTLYDSVFDPIASKFGFERVGPLKVLLRDENWYRIVSVERSRYGGVIYLYYFCNAACDPSPNVLSSYAVGRRLNRLSSNDPKPWCVETIEDLDAACSSVSRAISELALPFLLDMTWNRFLEEYESKLVNTPAAIAHAYLGDWGEVSRILDQDLAEIEQNPSEARRTELKDINRRLREATRDHAKFFSLLEEWRARNNARIDVAVG